MAAPEPTIHFFIPLYNEAKNVERAVEDIARCVADRKWQAIAVDDGSADDTPAVVERLAQKFPGRIRILSHAENRGVPEAFRTGFSAAVAEAADGDFIICAEGDGTSDPELIGEMTRRLAAGADVVIASRYLAGGGWKDFPLHRRMVSRLGNWGLRLLAPYPGVTDFTIFYRGYRAGFLRRVLEQEGTTAFGGRHFSANASLLFACFRQRPRVAEVAHVYRYGLKKSRSAFRVGAAVAGYLRLVLTGDFLRLRTLCKQARKANLPVVDTLSAPR